MTLDQFISKYENKGLDWDNAYGYQCVDLARFYWANVCEIKQPRGVSGAKDFWTNFDSDPNLNQNFIKIPNTPEGIPNKGDIMIWGSEYGPWGHIAIFLQGDVNEFICFSQNDPVGSLSIKKHYPNYLGVLGWFRQKKDVNEGVETPERADMLLEYLGMPNEEEAKKKLAEHLGERDGKCNWGAEGQMGGYLGIAREKLNNPPPTQTVKEGDIAESLAIGDSLLIIDTATTDKDGNITGAVYKK